MQRNITKNSVLCTVLLITSLCLWGCNKDGQNEILDIQEAPAIEAEETEDSEKKEVPEKHTQADVYVHVCGQVVNPGVYTLAAGSRVYEAIEAAGGLTENAGAMLPNQAAAVEDGQQIYIPAEGEAASQPGILPGESPVDDGRININTAAKEELMTLNGIGEARAAGIIKHREEHGGFQTIEELKQVEGIKEGIFNKVKDQIKVK